jgi:hypothetical protein
MRLERGRGRGMMLREVVAWISGRGGGMCI